MRRTPTMTLTSGMRVADRVLETFDYACVMRDRDTAAQLLAILQGMVERKVRRFGGDRREGGIDLGAAEERLRELTLRQG